MHCRQTDRGHRLPGSRRLSWLGALALYGCATATGAGHGDGGHAGAAQSTRESRAEPDKRLAVPTILPMWPERSVLDLGPLIVTDKRAMKQREEFFLAQADELGADGFVLEGRNIDEVYVQRGWSLASAWDAKHPGRSVAAILGLALLSSLGGTIPIQSPDGGAHTTQEQRFYRAFRYIDEVPAAVALGDVDVDLDRELLALFDRANTLAEQLDTAHGLLAAGHLQPNDYLVVRRALLSE